MIPIKEKRDAILYVHIKNSIKKWLKDNYKKMGYSTISEFVDDILSKIIKGDK